jgi:hypothetical protein
MTIERLSAIVDSIAEKNTLIEQIMGNDKQTSPILHYQKGNAPNPKLAEMSGKIMKMKEKLDVTLQNIKIDNLPMAEPILDILGKMLVSFRRLTYYSKKLETAQGKAFSETQQRTS